LNLQNKHSSILSEHLKQFNTEKKEYKDRLAETNLALN